LLRLSEALDRTENGHIRSVRCRILKGEVTLIPEALPKGDFEIRKATAVLPDFEKAFGVKAMFSSA
jgi:hypothetical protein